MVPSYRATRSSEACVGTSDTDQVRDTADRPIKNLLGSFVYLLDGILYQLGSNLHLAGACTVLLLQSLRNRRWEKQFSIYYSSSWDTTRRASILLEKLVY